MGYPQRRSNYFGKRSPNENLFRFVTIYKKERKTHPSFLRGWDVATNPDLNAAKNILKEGLKILNSAGTVENTGGAINKTSAKKHKAVKPEAHPIAFGVGG